MSSFNNNYLNLKVEEVIVEKLQTAIQKYRDNLDLQNLIDGVQQEVIIIGFKRYMYPTLYMYMYVNRTCLKTKMTSIYIYISIYSKHSRLLVVPCSSSFFRAIPSLPTQQECLTLLINCIVLRL